MLTWPHIDIAVSSKWMTYELWVNYPFKAYLRSVRPQWAEIKSIGHGSARLEADGFEAWVRSSKQTKHTSAAPTCPWLMNFMSFHLFFCFCSFFFLALHFHPNGCRLWINKEGWEQREWGGDKVEVKAGREGVKPFFTMFQTRRRGLWWRSRRPWRRVLTGAAGKPTADRNTAAAALRRRGCSTAAARGTLYTEDKDCWRPLPP